MRTRDVMSSPVVTVPPDAPLKDVAAILIERGINAVPVVDGHDRLVGIVSEADLLPAAGIDATRTAREVMSRSVYTLTEDTDAAAAARLMLRHRLKSAPVVAGDRVVGMVARRDLLRLISRSDDDIRAELEGRLKEEIETLQRLHVEVTSGVVTVAPDASPLARQLLEKLAQTVPGVVEVHTSQSPPTPLQPPEGDRR
jgi:CBS domain-containing protein